MRVYERMNPVLANHDRKLKPHRRFLRRHGGVASVSCENLEPRILLAVYSLSALPALDSYPAASTKLYLDFVGAPLTYWGSDPVPATPAYTTDTDATTFSDTELANIHEIWARVAEKYSPFNIDVTTVDPGSYPHNQVARVVIGGDGSWYWNPDPGYPNVGGISYTEISLHGKSWPVRWNFRVNK